MRRDIIAPQVEDRWETDVELNRDGWLVAACSDADVAWRDNDRAKWREWTGTSSLELTAEEARERFPSLQGPLISVDVRPGGHVNPVRVLACLVSRAEQRGTVIRRGVIAHGFDVKGDKLRAVLTSEGRIDCDVAVIAAGLWSSRLGDQLGFHIPFQRVRFSVGETGPWPEVIPGYLRGATFGARQNRDGTIRIAGGFRNPEVHHDLSLNDLRDIPTWAPQLLRHRGSVRFWADPKVIKHDVSTVVRGVSPVSTPYFPRGYEPAFSRRTVRRKLSALADLIPALAKARLRRRFGGAIELTPDLEPVLGRWPSVSNAYVISGFSGHGFMIAPAAGETVAAQIRGDGDTEATLKPYRPDRFATGDYEVKDQLF